MVRKWRYKMAVGQQFRIGSLWLFVGVLLFACATPSQKAGEEIASQATPAVQEEPMTPVEPSTINLSDGEELVLHAGMFPDDGSGWQAGYAAEGEETTSPGPTIIVQKGDSVTITFENAHYKEDGTPFGVEHNFTIVPDKEISWMDMEPLWDAHVGGSGDPNIAGGEHGSVTFVAEEAGSYFYVCALIDHIERGMWGQFIVTE
jgi:FtsP/CotA-like multicopper oxidase with cupredoxin domain